VRFSMRPWTKGVVTSISLEKGTAQPECLDPA
jgi:hypothetical protein